MREARKQGSEGLAVDKNEKRRRLLEAAVAILRETPDGCLQITNLNKALFYLDLVALRDLGERITKTAFVALKQGPVVARYQRRVVGDLESAGWARQNDALGHDDARPVALCNAGRDLEFEYLGEAERRLARAVAIHFSKTSAKAASDYSHRNLGWKTAFEQRHGKGAVPIDMHLALQQVAEDDPWLDEPADAEFDQAVRDAEHLGVRPWT